MKHTGNPAFVVQFDNSPKNSNPDKQQFVSQRGGRSTANMTTRKSHGSILLPSFAGVSQFQTSGLNRGVGG